MKKNKYEYLYIVQGYYTCWEDLCCSENKQEACIDYKAYCDNAPQVPYRVIKRRVKNE